MERHIEIIRLVSTGVPNIADKLLDAAAREARRLGYRRIIIHTLAEKGCSFLKAAGYLQELVSEDGSGKPASKLRVGKQSAVPKIRWTRELA